MADKNGTLDSFSEAKGNAPKAVEDAEKDDHRSGVSQNSQGLPGDEAVDHAAKRGSDHCFNDAHFTVGQHREQSAKRDGR